MALKNAFGDLALDATLLDVKARADLLASEAKLETVRVLLDAINTDKVNRASEATLAAVLEKLNAGLSVDTELAAAGALALESTQALLLTEATFTGRVPAGMTVTSGGLVVRGGGVPGGDASAGAGYFAIGPAIYNGVAWDRLRSAVSAAGSTGLGLLGAGMLGWDGTNFQRLALYGAVAGASGSTAGLLAVGSMMYSGAGGGFAIPFTVSNVGDASSGANVQSIGGYVYNGTTWDRLRGVAASAGNMGATGLLAAAAMQYVGGGQHQVILNYAASGAANDGVSLTGATYTMPGGYSYNGATWDRLRNNLEGTALASAARTVTTSSPDITNYNGDGAIVILRVSAITTAPSLVVTIEGKDPVSGVYYALNAAPVAVTAVGTYVYEVGEGASSGPTGGVTQRTAGQLPRTFRITVTHGNANSVTYSVGYSVISA